MYWRRQLVNFRLSSTDNREWDVFGARIFAGMTPWTAPGAVFVARVVLHVLVSDLLCFLDERQLVLVSQRFPLGPQAPANLRVVQSGVFLRQFPALFSGPDHERIHGTFNMVGGTRHSHCPC